MSPATDVADHIGGFVAAEGCFLRATSGSRFRFAVALGDSDHGSCDALRAVLGVGTVTTSPRRRPHFQDEVQFVVRRMRDLIDVIVPLMDTHLPVSYKREQYLAWRAELLRYWEDDSRRVRPCIRTGCDEPRRAKGLCRHHYYNTYGR